MPRKPQHLRQQALEKRQARIHLPKQEENDNMHPIHVIMVVGYFVSCFMIYNFFQDVELSAFQLLKIFCLLVGIGFLIPIKLYRKKLTMSMYEYIFFNLLGFSTISCALLFLLNASFKDATYEETYRITDIERIHKAYILSLEEDAYADKEYLRIIRDKDNIEKRGNQFYSISFSDGFLGVRIIEKKRLH